jgi:RNA polymerase sigma-70 factor (ECF subfamily)
LNGRGPSGHETVLSLTLTFDDLSGSSDALVERLRRHERSALGEAFDAYHAPVRALARRVVGEDAAAEDLVQEVFVALPRAIQRFEGRARLKTFLLSMVLNHAKHHVRAAVRRRALADRFGKVQARAFVDGVEEVSRSELAWLLTRALDQLPLEQRLAFVLMELEERTSAEAGEIAGAPEATMRTRLFHAKRRLREQLEEWGVR